MGGRGQRWRGTGTSAWLRHPGAGAGGGGHAWPPAGAGSVHRHEGCCIGKTRLGGAVEGGTPSLRRPVVRRGAKCGSLRGARLGTGPGGEGILPSRCAARRIRSKVDRPCAPDGASEGKMPSPPGPVAAARACRQPSDLLRMGLRREGILPSLARASALTSLQTGRSAPIGAPGKAECLPSEGPSTPSRPSVLGPPRPCGPWFRRTTRRRRKEGD